jgi:ABC-type branched-subunit amino acid transport system ATPase component
MGKEVEIKPVLKTKASAQETFENMNLFSDLIMVEKVHVETKTKKANLIISATGGALNTTADLGDMVSYPYQATVLRVGSGVYSDKVINMEVEPGDLLYLNSPLDLNREVIMIDGVAHGLIHKSKIICSFKALK